MECLFAEFLAVPTQKKWSHSSSNSFNNHCNKRTCVDPQKVEARSEHSFAQDELILGTGTSFEQQEQELFSPPSSPTMATINPEDRTVARNLKSTGDQAYSDSES